jgi:tetraacyldisaccharide 4'-kinase
MRAPSFWNRRGAVAVLLAPLGKLYGASVAFKAAHASPSRAPMPVICVGNLTAGGSGKTPVAIAIGEMLKAQGHKPVFLTRGYGGKAAAPVLVKPHHGARIVGDEALLLARTAPTIVARDRAIGAARAAVAKADVLVMDDGHQNFALAKDLSLVVVDGGGGFQNGMVLPAGPLREPVAQGLKRADAVIIMGSRGRSPQDGHAAKRAPGIPELDNFKGLVLYAHLQPLPNDFAGRRVFAFAGIGRPRKFFDTLKAAGALVAGTQDFADHHNYDAQDLQGLRDQAKGDLLVTTEKDLVRIPAEQRRGIAALAVEARFDDPAVLAALLARIVS